MKTDKRKTKFSFINFIATPGGIIILIIISRLLYRYFKYDSFSLF